jgi:hypothetical protein
MSAIDYAELQADVAALLADFGPPVPATWRTLRPGVRTESGRVLSQATVDYPCYAVVLPTERVGDETIHQADDQNRKGCSTAYVSAPVGLPQLPSGADLLIVGAKQYRLEALDLLAPDGTLLLITATVQ